MGEFNFPERRKAGGVLAPVLLVEDDDVHALLVESSLEAVKMANPVVRARTGDEAVDYLQDSGPNGHSAAPALVLLDLELPGRSGLEVLEILVGLDSVSACPVIMMSASSDSASIARARALGVRGYLIKPVAFDALADVIHRLGLPWALLVGEADECHAPPGPASLSGAMRPTGGDAV